jgi:hypothetical protein
MTTYNSVFGGDTVPPSEYAYRAVTLTANTTLYWPDNTDSTDLVASIMDVTASAGLSITLPAANEVSTGRDMLIKNVGSETFTVRDNAGNSLATIDAGVGKFFYLTSNATVAGTWRVLTYGTGTSGADASALAGAGLVALSNTLNQESPVVGFGGTHTVADGDRASLLKYTGGTGTWYLPAPLANGFFFLLTNVGTGTLTLNANTYGSTIDDMTSKAIQPFESMFVICDGTEWFSVGYGRSTEFEFTQLAVDVSTLGSTATITSAQAANKLWYFYGTASGDITVTIPAVASVYFVRVGGIGAGNELTFTTGSGSSLGITPNQSYTIYCDGTNVVAAQTVAVSSNVALDDGSATTPALSFALDPDTGLYRSTSNVLGITAGGVAVALFGPSGVTLTNDLAVTEGGTGASTASGARTNLGLAIGTDVQAYDADLAALAGLSSTGLISRTGAGTAATRTLTAPAAGITVTNGDGVSGNPTLVLANDLAALEGLSTAGLIARTGDGTATTRTVTAGSSKVAVTNGDGVSGNPTVDVTEANLTLNNIGGTLGITKGGTGQTAKTAAFDALAPTTSKGDLIAYDGTDNVRVAVGTANQVLASDGSATAGVAWKDVLSLGAISVPVSIANGGTGATTASGARTNLDAVGVSDSQTLTNKNLGSGTSVSAEVTNTATSALQVPVGTTAQRPTGADGKVRYNSDLDKYEGYNGSNWLSLGGGATGGGTNAAFYLNDKVVNTDYTIPSDQNAMSAGPITINSGVTVTVPSGSTWSIVGS